MNRSLVWGTTLIVLLGIAALAGRASQAPIQAQAAAPSRMIESELARCRTAGQDDEACRAAWAAAREHFFGRPAS